MTLKQRLKNADTSTSEGREELSRVLGEVLQPKKKDHRRESSMSRIGVCVFCGKPYYRTNKNLIAPPLGDCIINPILLDDWNVAMKYFRAVSDDCGEDKLIKALWHVYAESGYAARMGMVRWLATKAQPKHYLQAAAYCVLNEKEQE